MPNKTIWLINQYSSTPQTGMGGRHFYLAEELVKQGYKVYLVGASYHHLLRKPPEVNGSFHLVTTNGIQVTWVKTPYFQSAHSKRRIINWLWFSFKLLFLYNFIGSKPDVIVYSSPAPFGIVPCRWLAYRFGAKLVFEVRDIWPLSLIELGGYSKGNPFIWLLQQVEDYAYRVSDKVISNLPNAVAHMTSRGMDAAKFVWIPNGFSRSEIERQQTLSPSVMAQLPKGKFIVGYAGTIGLANALDTLVKAAGKLKAFEDIYFVLVGQGQQKLSLQGLANQLQISNILFLEPVNKNEIQSLLGFFNVCYLGLTKDPIFRFGVSPNKLFDYMVNAKPILYAIDSANKPVEEASCGLTVPAEDPSAVAEAILALYQANPKELLNMGQNGQAYAYKHHDYKNLAETMSALVIES